MTEAVILLAGVIVGAAVALLVVHRRRSEAAAPTRRILFPYVGSQLSVRALDAALRIARVEDATLVAAYLLPVPMALSLDAPLPRACGSAFELQEAIEQRAQAAGITVDARIATGRTVRHALRRLLDEVRYDRLVAAAKTAHTDGLSAAEVGWLLEHATGEVAVVRPADETVLDGLHRVVQPQERPTPRPQRMVGVHV
jgi:nucleotide-binding universal stress UspA family protein